VIRRYLGSRQDTVPDLRLCSEENGTCTEANQGAQLLPGDILLLCSDGLTDLVGDSEILGVIQRLGTGSALDELVKAANRRGGHDNITILLIEVPSPAAARVPSPVSGSRNRVLPALLAAGAALVVIAALFVGTLWFLNRSEGRRDNPGLKQPESQVTLFASTPGAGAQPDSAPLAQPSPGSPVENPNSGAPRGTPALFPTPAATLTAWPTNTPGAP
jgi:protein phosphatase